MIEGYWRPEFCSPEPDSTRYQVEHALDVAANRADQVLFLFVNVSATHVPHGDRIGDSSDSWQSQSAALAYADEHLGWVVSVDSTIVCAHQNAAGARQKGPRLASPTAMPSGARAAG
ncbi:hypothetical protein ABH930_006543 [Kitasatospora sp. GAS204A]|nr:hypothetical protein [Kitasatospora sp. GAS204B]